MELEPVKIGLWDQYGGSMPSGWTRWILEQHEFEYERVFARELDAGGLDLVTDNVRTADEDNPKGYFEYERVKVLALRRGDVPPIASPTGRDFSHRL